MNKEILDISWHHSVPRNLGCEVFVRARNGKLAAAEVCFLNVGDESVSVRAFDGYDHHEFKYTKLSEHSVMVESCVRDSSISDDAILAICARLQAAAIKCDDYHVFVSYAPHVASLTVYVERTDTNYLDSNRVVDRLVYERVYIDRPDSLEKLTALADQLKRLGIDV